MIFKQCKGHEKRKKKRKAAFKICIKHQPCLPFIWKLSNAPSCFHFWHLVSKKENEPPYRINEKFVLHCMYFLFICRTWPFQTQTWNESNYIFQLTSMAERKSTFGHHLFRSLFGGHHWCPLETFGIGTTHCCIPGLPRRTFYASSQTHDFAFDHCFTHHW